MERVVRHVYPLAKDLDHAADKPTYVAVAAPPRPPSASQGGRTYMGIAPGFGEQVHGMKLSGVRDGSPAAKAGIQSGDIIVKFGNVEIRSLYAYTYAL
jgi:aminopeptidase YwaD